MVLGNDDFRTPGQLLDALLTARGWTKRTLAIVLGMDETGLNRVISDKRPVDADLALMLEELFGVSAERFLELQKLYDLGKARLAARPDPERTTRAHLYGGLPISEMIKRGWIHADDVRDVDTVQTELMRFFGANRVEDIETLPHAAKKTQVSTEVTPAQLAWLYRVKQIAGEMLVARYSPAAVHSAITKLKGLLSAPEEARKVPRILAESGIRFAIVESLPAAKIDGVCFWLNDHAPVIALSMRFDRIDNFWFVLRHELEHVAQRHGLLEMMFDTDMESDKSDANTDSEEERIANEAAAEFCVPRKMMGAFIARKAPFFNERDIIGFARTIGVHPGLVAGQLRHTLKRYDRWANHLVKMRSLIAPSAIVDGWGDIVPVGL